MLTYNLGEGSAEGVEFRNYVDSRGISWRDDSPMVGYYVDYFKDTYSVASPAIFANSYKNRLTVMENQHYNYVKNEGNWIGQDGSVRGAEIFRGAMRLLHATYIGYQGYASEWLKDNPNLTKQLANECGYWYSIENSTIPTMVLQVAEMKVGFQWHNHGIAPAYKPYQIHFKLDGNETRIFKLDNSNNKTWMDNSSKAEQYAFIIPQNMIAGTYSVKAKLYDPESGRSIDLGMNNNIKDPEGFFTVGSVVIGNGGNSLLPPNAPGLVQAIPTSESKILLQWKDNSTNETGFVIERKIAGTNNFMEVSQLKPGTTSYNDSTLNSGTNYTFRIGAVNLAGTTYSQEISAKTFRLNLILSQILLSNPIMPIHKILCHGCLLELLMQNMLRARMAGIQGFTMAHIGILPTIMFQPTRF